MKLLLASTALLGFTPAFANEAEGETADAPAAPIPVTPIQAVPRAVSNEDQCRMIEIPVTNNNWSYGCANTGGSWASNGITCADDATCWASFESADGSVANLMGGSACNQIIQDDASSQGTLSVKRCSPTYAAEGAAPSECTVDGVDYYAKPKITAMMIMNSDCVDGGKNRHRNCSTGMECGGKGINGNVDSPIAYNAADEAAVKAQCLGAAECATGQSGLKFAWINRARAPSGCIYDVDANVVIFNKAKGNRGTAAGYRAICQIEKSANADYSFAPHETLYSISDEPCASRSDSLFTIIDADTSADSITECRFVASHMGRAQGAQDVQRLQRAEAPKGCVLNTTTGKVFYNDHPHGSSEANGYKSFCRLDIHLAAQDEAEKTTFSNGREAGSKFW